MPQCGADLDQIFREGLKSERVTDWPEIRGGAVPLASRVGLTVESLGEHSWKV